MRAYPVRWQNKVVLTLDGTTIRDPHVPQNILAVYGGDVVLSYDEAVTLLRELQDAVDACSTEPLGEEATTAIMAELREKLPEKDIHVHDDQTITFYDYHAVTYRHTNAEDAVVDQYLREIVCKKVGADVMLTDQGSAGNGHEWRRFVCTAKEQ